MASNREFVWNYDHYVYHITDAFTRIVKEGLKPKVGLRSSSAGDFVPAIYFFNELENLPLWISVLYGDEIAHLKVLRFSVKRRKCYIHNGGDEFYLKRPVSISKISVLELIDEDGKPRGLDALFDKDGNPSGVLSYGHLQYHWVDLSKYDEQSIQKPKTLDFRPTF